MDRSNHSLEQDISTFEQCIIKHESLGHIDCNGNSCSSDPQEIRAQNDDKKLKAKINVSQPENRKVAFAGIDSEGNELDINDSREGFCSFDDDEQNGNSDDHQTEVANTIKRLKIYTQQSTLSSRTSSVIDSEFDLRPDNENSTEQPYGTAGIDQQNSLNENPLLATTSGHTNLNQETLFGPENLVTTTPNILDQDSTEASHIVVTVPESSTLVPEPKNSQPSGKNVPDTIIRIPLSVPHIPDRSLGRRNFQRDLPDVSKCYDPNNMCIDSELESQYLDNNTLEDADSTKNENNMDGDRNADASNEKEFSLLSEDGNVLNSPVSRRLISEFGKLAMQGLLSQNNGQSVNEVNKLTPENENADTSLSIAGIPDSKKGKNVTVINDDSQNEDMDKPTMLTGRYVSCRYSTAGCAEKLEKGSMYEQDHYLTCKYRPIKCLLAPACDEVLCHYNYIPHLMQHFLVPTYSNEMVSTVVLTPEDFTRGQTWTPKWFAAHDHHFFSLISRKENGTWASWVWMLGSNDEADEFAVRITLFKRFKEVSQVFPVHSIRTEQEEIETERTCLLVNDETMHELTQVGENMFTDFSMRVVLIPDAKELNDKIRVNRSLPSARSKPLRSEKLYITTIDAEE